MSVRNSGALITWTTGSIDSPPVLLLHDRYLDHTANDAFAGLLEADHRVVSVRAARTQMEAGLIKGYYWHLGPLDQPELSTLGDALSHLERLLTTLNDSTGQRVALLGSGEGGSVALLLALLWRERISAIVSIDGPIARNVAEMPLTFPDPDGLPVLLVERLRDLKTSHDRLVQHGAEVTVGSHTDAQIADWSTNHSRR